MKRFSQYVSSLLPGFARSQIEEDIRMLKDTIRDVSIPLYESASENFGLSEFNSKETKEFDKTFENQLKNTQADYDSNYPNTILKQQKNTLEVLEMLDGDLDKYFDKEVTKGSITYSHTNILKYLELCNFNLKYVRKLLQWTYQKEQESYGQKVDSPFTQAELSWMFENRDLFFRSMSILSIPKRKVKGLFKDLPKMVVAPEEVDVVEETVGSSKVDPMGMGFLPPKLNPIYHIRMKIAEYQAMRYEQSLEEKRALEYRLLALKDAREGKRDAKLEQEIEYTENRVKKLNYKLSKFEEE